MSDPQTHHPTCYRDPTHHACAVARLDRLHAAMEGLPPGPWTLPSFEIDDSYWRVTFDAVGSDHSFVETPAERVVALLVAVRDITEGR